MDTYNLLHKPKLNTLLFSVTPGGNFNVYFFFYDYYDVIRSCWSAILSSALLQYIDEEPGCEPHDLLTQRGILVCKTSILCFYLSIIHYDITMNAILNNNVDVTCTFKKDHEDF